MKKKNENKGSWLSISDMMSGILAIFIIYFVIQSLELQGNINQIKKEKAKINKERSDYKVLVDRIYSVKVKIIERIKSKLDVKVDEKTGSIKLDSSILFDTGEYKLKDNGKRYLRRIMPQYLEILLSDKEIRNNLSGIIIEGHTDRQGSYLHNLDLSQKRANSVAQFIFSRNFPNFKGKEYLKKYITANGRSYSFYIGKKGTFKSKASRRVEIKFQLNDSEVVEELKKMVERNNGGHI